MKLGIFPLDVVLSPLSLPQGTGKIFFRGEFVVAGTFGGICFCFIRFWWMVWCGDSFSFGAPFSDLLPPEY